MRTSNNRLKTWRPKGLIAPFAAVIAASIPMVFALQLVAGSGAAFAQVVVIEGPVSAVVDTGSGTGTITVMGVVVSIPADAPLNSPAAALTMAELADTTALPGRMEAGFLGATATITGVSTGTNDTAQADGVFVEPAEHVSLSGVVTNVSPLSVQGVETVDLLDARIPFGGAVDRFGVPIDSATIVLGSPATVQGYFGNDGKLYIYALEAEGVPLGMAEQVTITRARCRPGRLEVQGEATPGLVEILDADTGVVLGSTDSVAGIPLGSYRVRLPTLCPTAVQVRLNGGAAFSTVNPL